MIAKPRPLDRVLAYMNHSVSNRIQCLIYLNYKKTEGVATPSAFVEDLPAGVTA